MRLEILDKCNNARKLMHENHVAIDVPPKPLLQRK